MNSLKEELIILINSFFGGIINGVMFVYINNFNLPNILYTVLVFSSYFGSILSSLIFGSIVINNKNYINISLFGIFGPFISIILLLSYDPILYVLSLFIFNSTHLATYFAFLRYYLDVKINFKFSLYLTIGLAASQIFLLFLDIIFIIYLLIVAYLVFFVIYLAKNRNKELISEIYLLERIDNALDKLEASLVQFSIFESNNFPFKFKDIKIDNILLYNLFVLLGYSILWTTLVNFTNFVNLGSFYPLFLFINNLFTVILYKIYPNTLDLKKIIIGFILRAIIGIFIIGFLMVKLSDMKYMIIFVSILYILTSISWTLFQYFFDMYILKYNPEKFGRISLFRNVGGLFGSLFYLSFKDLFLASIIGIFFIFLSIIWFDALVIHKRTTNNK